MKLEDQDQDQGEATAAQDSPTLRRARALARGLDEAFAIPGTQLRFGLDSILGLIPGFGDVASASASSYLVWLAVREGAGRALTARMLFNIGVDTLFGSIPVVGDLFDLGFKANTRNLALLERHLAQPRTTEGRSVGLFVGLLVGGALALLAALTLLFWLIAQLWGALGG